MADKQVTQVVNRFCLRCGGSTKHIRILEYNAFAWPQHRTDTCRDCGKVL